MELSNRHPKKSPKVKVMSYQGQNMKHAKLSVLHLKLFLIVLRLMQYSTQTLYVYDIYSLPIIIMH